MITARRRVRRANQEEAAVIATQAATWPLRWKTWFSVVTLLSIALWSYHNPIVAKMMKTAWRRPGQTGVIRVPANKTASITSRPFPVRPVDTSGSCAESCAVSHNPILRATRNVIPKATAVTSASTGTDKWWKKEAELWVDVHTVQDFQNEVLNNHDGRFVVVDFFATWCQGCQRSYPELCKLAKDPEVTKNFKFVKVCVDELKRLAKDEGVKALPFVQVYQEGTGAVVGMDVPASKVRNLKHNLQVISLNPDMSFRADPNGFVVPLPRQAAQSNKDKLAAAAQQLNSSSGSLFDRLLNLSTPTAGDRKAHSAALDSDLGKSGYSVPKEHGAALAKAAFVRQYASDYGYGGLIDSLYPCEVGCRMKENEHYLDYTGSSVYCQSQLEAVFNELRSGMFGNPHSENPSSHLTSERVEEVRDLVLRYFKADPAEYQVVFTRSATDSLKIIGETFPWSEGSVFRYLRENHNSVLGIREYALDHGSTFEAVNESYVEDWLCSVAQNRSFDNRTHFNLFAFPAEDNFAGVKYPLAWVEQIRSKSTSTMQWKVLVDAAAYVPTQPLDLSKVPADFVTLSFYKMFGYPTGLGALIVRVDSASMLKKKFWGGGTVALATSSDNFHVLKCRPTDKLEDGTVAFLDIISLKHGFAMIDKLGGIERIQAHVAALAEYLYNRLVQLQHSNGRPLVAVFGKHHLPNHREVQGAILNFEMLNPDGGFFSYKTFEREAAEAGFHVRTGAECNPGACYNYLGVQEREIEALAGKKEGCEDDVEFITVERPASPSSVIGATDILSKTARTAVGLGHPAEVALKWVEVPLGSVRASLGYMSTFEDCYALVEWMSKKYKDRYI